MLHKPQSPVAPWLGCRLWTPTGFVAFHLSVFSLSFALLNPKANNTLSTEHCPEKLSALPGQVLRQHFLLWYMHGKSPATALLQRCPSPLPQVRIPRLTLCFLPPAAACEFLDIVELLLKSGANPTLRDQEGCLPEEVTDCKAITSALQQHTTGKA